MLQLTNIINFKTFFFTTISTSLSHKTTIEITFIIYKSQFTISTATIKKEKRKKEYIVFTLELRQKFGKKKKKGRKVVRCFILIYYTFRFVSKRSTMLLLF